MYIYLGMIMLSCGKSHEAYNLTKYIFHIVITYYYHGDNNIFIVLE